MLMSPSDVKIRRELTSEFSFCIQILLFSPSEIEAYIIMLKLKNGKGSSVRDMLEIIQC